MPPRVSILDFNKFWLSQKKIINSKNYLISHLSTSIDIVASGVRSIFLLHPLTLTRIVFLLYKPVRKILSSHAFSSSYPYRNTLTKSWTDKNNNLKKNKVKTRRKLKEKIIYWHIVWGGLSIFKRKIIKKFKKKKWKVLENWVKIK